MKDTLRKLAELTLTHVATFAFPLVFAVWCGRVLGVHDFGVVSFYTALAAFLAVIIEFGFDWLGIREVSQAGTDAEHRRRTLCTVTAARLLICLVTSVLVATALLWLRGAQQATLIVPMVAYMVGFAMDVSWYLRALERTRLLLLITALTRACGIVVLCVAVSHPGSLAAALWAYAFVAITSAALTWATLAREGSLLRSAWPRLRAIIELMRRSSAILAGNLCAALLTNGGIALLAFTSDPSTIGAANLALRVKMAGQAALLPAKQLAFVRLSASAHTQHERALRIGRLALAGLLAGGSAISVVIYFAAEAIVHLVFRGDYPVAVGLILLLGLSVPLNAAAELLGMQCLIAFGQERSYALAVMTAGIVFSALLLWVLHGPLAYGWALLAAELSLTTLAALRLRSVIARMS